MPLEGSTDFFLPGSNVLRSDLIRRCWRRIRSSRKTVLMISHDRDLLAGAVDAIVTLEGHGAWVHGSSYRDYPEARRRRQEQPAFCRASPVAAPGKAGREYSLPFASPPCRQSRSACRREQCPWR